MNGTKIWYLNKTAPIFLEAVIIIQTKYYKVPNDAEAANIKLISV